MNAIDLSYATLDTTQLDGIELVIQDLWTGAEQPPPRVANLRAALAAGKRIAGYFAINPAVASNADQARAGVPDDIWAQLAFVAPDCELYPDLTPAKVRQESDHIVALTLPPPNGPRLRVLYTVESYWRDVMGDDYTFTDHWLWNARPGRPFAPFGAWSWAALEIGYQSSSSEQLGRMTIDEDVFRMELLMVSTPAPAPLDIVNARLLLAASSMNNDMAQLVRQLVYLGVLPAGTVAARPAVGA